MLIINDENKGNTADEIFFYRHIRAASPVDRKIEALAFIHLFIYLNVFPVFLFSLYILYLLYM